MDVPCASAALPWAKFKAICSSEHSANGQGEGQTGLLFKNGWLWYGQIWANKHQRLIGCLKDKRQGCSCSSPHPHLRRCLYESRHGKWLQAFRSSSRQASHNGDANLLRPYRRLTFSHVNSKSRLPGVIFVKERTVSDSEFHSGTTSLSHDNQQAHWSSVSQDCSWSPHIIHISDVSLITPTWLIHQLASRPKISLQ